MTNAEIIRARQVERTVIYDIVQNWKVTYKETDRYHCADFVLYRQRKPVGLVEVKERDTFSYTYSHTVLEAKKAEKMLDCAKGIPVWFVIYFKDTILYTEIDRRLPYERKVMRVQTPLSGIRDQENLLIPVTDFRTINVVPPALSMREEARQVRVEYRG